MTRTRAVSIEDVRTLVGERQRYDDWLAALEAKRAETPARVFERVHADYSSRRNAVMEQLHTHVATLAELGAELEGRLAEQETRLAALEDERVEAMLRTAVGEFDGERWETVRREVEASIAEHTDNRDLLLMEVDEVRTLLASARAEPAAPAPAAEPPATVDVEQAHGDAVHGDPLPAGEASPSVERDGEGGTITSGPDADGFELTEASPEAAAHEARMDSEALDIDDALAVFSPEAATSSATAADSSAPAAARGTSTPSAGSPSADPFDDLAFLRSVIDREDRGSAHAHATANTNAHAPERGGQATATGTSAPQKTLRCTECGTMNLPTEWYCERCGGELAAF